MINLKKLLLLFVLVPIFVLANFEELVIDNTIKPVLLKEVAYTIHNEIDMQVNEYKGYKLSDIRVEVIKIEGEFVLKIINSTPRKFEEINLIVDNAGITIPQELNPFSYQEIELQEITLLENSKIKFLDPNPQYTPNPIRFHNSNDTDSIQRYQLLQTHLKILYAQQGTRDKFYDYFFNRRRESRTSMLGKWHRMATYNHPKDFRIYQSGSAGVASNGWLSLNWVMSKFKQNARYPYAYGTFSHEYAHTMGFNHSSGLAYGWDSYVKSGIHKLMNTETITPGEIPVEKANVFWFFDKADSSMTAYTKDDRFSLNNIRFIFPMGVVKSTNVTNNKIFITFGKEPRYGKILINNNIRDKYKEGGDNKNLANYIIDDWNYAVQKYEMKVGAWSQNYSADASGSAVYFYIPNQESVVSTNGQDVGRRYWYRRGTTNVVVKVTHIQSGRTYNLTLFGRANAGALIQSGLSRGNGRVVFWVDFNSNKNLPIGKYRGSFKVVARGWNDTRYTRDLIAKIDYEVKPEVSQISLVTNQKDEVKIVESKRYNFRRGHKGGFSQVYFVTDDPNNGPIRRRWSGRGYTALNVPVYDMYNKKNILKLRGIRVRHYGNKAQMNTGQNYYNYSDSKFRLEFHREDNPHLKEGRYTTSYNKGLTVIARGWHRNFEDIMNFKIDIFLSALNAPTDFNVTTREKIKVIESKTYDFTKGHKNGFSQVYFVTNDSNIGPTNRIWSGRGYTTLKVPVYDIYDREYILKLRGIRVRHYGNKVQMNTGQNYSNYSDSRFRLEYHSSDNTHLPNGRYKTAKDKNLNIFARGLERNFEDLMRFKIDVNIDK
jgi:hypothetical protein